MKNFDNLYKAIGAEQNNSLDSDWNKIELHIECSDSHIGTAARYLQNGEWKDNVDLYLTREAKLSLTDFHNNAENLNFTPWNEAVYTIERNGHFDMKFEWNQALQDEWDNA